MIGRTSWRPVALAAVLLVPATAGAVDGPPSPPASPSPAAPSPAPTPAPTPLPVLMGPGYETLRALAAGLSVEMGHVLDGTQAAVAMGRPARMFLPGIRMFARRAEGFRDRVERYRTEPFDVVGTAAVMHARAGILSRRARRNEALQPTWEDWDAAADILDRIKRLLAGEKVAVPSPHPPRPAPTPTPTPAATPTPG